MLGLAAARSLGRVAAKGPVATSLRQPAAPWLQRCSGAPVRVNSSVAVNPSAFGLGTAAAVDGSSAVSSKLVDVLLGRGQLVKEGYEKAVGYWLVGASGLLYSMIGIGGYTRLSGSGLSMTDWRIEGRSLPRSEELWKKEFEDYKRFPEYQRLHNGTMELTDFKRIYFVEWFHRMWGRGVGVYFAVPLVYLGARRIIRGPLLLRLTGLLGLGISQAFVGWWMVRSGFDPPEKHTPTLGQNQRPRVSPYRLASHWTAALTLYVGVVWNALTLLRPSPAVAHGTAEALAAAAKCRRLALLVAAAVGLTLLSGPFIAGNDAGRAFNTWPKMNYDWVPPEWVRAVANPVANMRLFFEETAVVQFNHRTLAYASVFGALGLSAYGASLPLWSGAAVAVRLLPLAVGAQMCLGIATLLLYVPIELGVAHQAGGVLVLTSLVAVLHALRLPAAGVLALPAEAAAAVAAGAAASAAA